jgi:hypothetical protein
MADFETKDGKTVSSGKTYTLTLCKGVDQYVVQPDGTVLSHGDYSERKVRGLVQVFDQDGETHWEIKTGVPQYPAIGFLPENVLTHSGK